jgi:flagellar export protein FliJ
MAKKFRFTLQTVLMHREHLQEQAQIALSHALALQVKLEGELTQLQQEYAEQEKARPSMGPGELIMRTIAYLEFLKYAIVLKAKKVEEQKVEVEAARKVLVAKSRDTKALEILRDHQQEEFRKISNVKETKLLDDFGSTQFIRLQASHD